MIRSTIALAVAAVMFALSAAGQTGGSSAGKGAQLFEKDGCYQCHGHVGQGSRDGARIASTSMNQQAFLRYVRRPFGAMPAFTEKVVTDQDLIDIYAYLKALPPAKAPKDIPLLNQLREK